GVEGDVYFLTMELVPGGLTLHKQWKDAKTAPALLARMSQVAEVARAIDHANARGVIHRDLKPANVLVTPEGRTLVADFGLAKDEEDVFGLTRSDDRLGTPLFMAPEQVRRGSLAADHRLDVWSLGVMTFVAATGRYPFRGRTIMDLYMKILHDEPDWEGLRSEAPSREGYGVAPPPREIQEIEKRLSETPATVLLPGSKPNEAGEKTEKPGGGAVAPLASRPSLPPLPAGPPPFAPPRDTEGVVPRDLRLVIGMALAKEPQKRYATAGALARDLERFLKGEPVGARPPGKLELLVRRARRVRVAILAGALALLLPLLVYLEKAREDANERAAQEQKQKEEEAKRKLEAESRARREKAAREANEEVDRIWSREILGAPTIDSYKKAASELTPVCERYPDQPAPFVKRGLAHAFALEEDEAWKDLGRAQANLAANPGLSADVARSGVLLALLHNDPASAASLAKTGLAAIKGSGEEAPAGDEARLRVALSRVLLELGSLRESEEQILPLLRPNGTVAETWALGAEVALARGDPALAAIRAGRARELAPDDPEVATALGLVSLARGEPERAASALREAREAFGTRAPTEARFFYDLARNRRLDRAHPDIPGSILADDRAGVLAPWSPIPWFWRGDTELRKQHELASAIDDFDRCMKRDPTFDEAAELRSDLLL
ncbi:protein kinase, partial [bacterium]|nr:protein kinase [bacterium]